MGMDPEIDDVMARKPRARAERIIDARMWWGILSMGIVMAIASLLTIDAFLPGGLIEGHDTLAVARTAGFTTLVLTQLVNAFNSRSETTSAFRRAFSNRWLLGSVVLAVILQVAVVEVPFLNTAFGTAPLDLAHWGVCVLAASSVLWSDEVRKLILRRMGPKAVAPPSLSCRFPGRRETCRLGNVPITYVVIPQWQGSGSTRALQLLDGAEAIRGDLPGSNTVLVDIPLGAGEHLASGVRRLSSLQVIRDRTEQALEDTSGVVLTIGGDCGVDLAPVSHAHRAHPGDLALVWLDAHADLNSPESSQTGAFHGMVLRAILGDGFPSMVLDNPLTAERIVLAGTRSLDESEAEFIAESGIRMIAPDDLTPDSLVAAIAATGASAVYLHVDLDILDPAEFASLGYPEPFGVSAVALIESIRAITARFTLVGAAITEFAPSSPEAAADDLPTILRIIGALTS